MHTTGDSLRKLQIGLVIVNGIIFLSTLIQAVIGFLYGAGSGQLGNYVIGFGYFKPFTMDSNILAGVSSLVMLYYGIQGLVKKENMVPRWAAGFQLMTSAGLLVTFSVVALFLAPMQVLQGRNYFVMYSEDMFFFHLVNPLLAAFSFIYLLGKYHFSKRTCILGLIPEIIYSVVYFMAVIILKAWDDFYGFTLGGHYFMIPVAVIAIYGLGIGASVLLVRLHNKQAGFNRK